MPTRDAKQSLLRTRNVTVGNKRTSMRLEPQMWSALERIAGREGVTINNLCTQIDRRRNATGLTSATRVFIVNYFRYLTGRYEGRNGGLIHEWDAQTQSLKGADRADWVLETVAAYQTNDGAVQATRDGRLNRPWRAG